LGADVDVPNTDGLTFPGRNCSREQTRACKEVRQKDWTGGTPVAWGFLPGAETCRDPSLEDGVWRCNERARELLGSSCSWATDIRDGQSVWDRVPESNLNQRECQKDCGTAG